MPMAPHIVLGRSAQNTTQLLAKSITQLMPFDTVKPAQEYKHAPYKG